MLGLVHIHQAGGFDLTRNRFAWTGAWSRDHNNPRYAELLPRLSSVDRYYIDMHPWWPVRGFRRRVQLPLESAALDALYPAIFCTDWRQIRFFHSPCVVDHDDPVYAPSELAALSRRNVALIVVTTTGVRDRLLAAGVAKPIEIIPQGVALPQVNSARVMEIRARWSPDPDAVVVGIHQPHFDFAEELGADPMDQMYAVDDLFMVMEQAAVQNTKLVLWLVGRPSALVTAYARQHEWVRLVGYQARTDLFSFVSAFDLGVYPRKMDLGGRSSVKVLEYLACGVPVVGFDVEEMKIAASQRAGTVAKDAPELSQAIVNFATDKVGRQASGAHGREIASRFDWDRLALDYQELLDEIPFGKTNS
jgi:glycosyltransferase involved in cell wall biosynthesis